MKSSGKRIAEQTVQQAHEKLNLELYIGKTWFIAQLLFLFRIYF